MALSFSAESVALTLQRVNALQVSDLQARPGVLTYVPIHLVNADEVVSAQFDIELPFAIPTDATATLSARADGHSVSFTGVTWMTYKYRVVLMSLANRTLRGNKGLLLSIPMLTGNSAVGSTYDIRLSDIVLADINGHNIATSTTASGVFTVTRDDLPDLVVKNVALGETQSGPGQQLTVNYTVANEGGGPTGGGWAEKVCLQGPTGEKIYLGMQNYLDVLAKDATVQRSFTVRLPQVLHVDGACRAVVEVVPFANTGELATDRANNIGVSEQTVDISKRLTLTANKTTIYEGWRNGYVTVTLMRSGDWSRAESFTVAADIDNLVTCNGLTLPRKVTIPARAAGVSLRVAAVNDAIVRAGQVVLSVAAQNGYDACQLTLKRVDDDRNPLSLSVSPDPVGEGQTLTVTALRGGELTDELTLTAACSAASRFDQPFVFHFEAGAATSTLQITATDNDLEELDCAVTLTASAPDYAKAKTTFQLTDNDRPALTMTLSQPTVAENVDNDADALPLVAVISRDRGLAAPATVYLTSSRKEVFFANTCVTIPAGASRVEVPLHVTDNSAVDGTRSVRLTASLFVASAGRVAPQGDRACAVQELTVVDDEQPYITLSCRVQAVGEGGSATITVRRVQADVSAPLSVKLTADDARVTFQPVPVTIAAGSYTATATVRVARNSTSDDAADILICAEAADFANAYLRMHVTDRTLPDAVCTKVECIGPRFYSGLPATLCATVRNYGTKTLPQGVTIDCYVSSSYRYYLSRATHLCQVTTDRDLEPGDEADFEFEAQLPERVGSYYVWARVNADRVIEEYDFSNNLSRKFGYMNILAPFQVSEVSVSDEDCLPGSAVTVSGRMTAVEEGLLNGQTVRVMLVGTGQNSSATTQIDAAGNFSANVRIDRSARGYLTVKALAVGQTEAAKTTRLHVYNQSLACADGTRWVVKEGVAHEGSFTWTNTCAKPITVAALELSSPLPDGCTITFTQPAATIAAGQKITIPYTVLATRPSSTWHTFTVTATSAEGVVSSLPITFRCQATTSWLVIEPSRLKTTMLFGRNRDCEVVVRNIGLKATGTITGLAQDDWVIHDAASLSSLAPGESTTVHLTLLASPQKHVGRTYASSLQLKPEEGPAVLLPIAVTVTGNEYGTFVLHASDVYSLAAADNSHLAGASVTVRSVRGNRIVYSGSLDANATWQTDQMREGTYDVTITAPRHVSVTQRLAFGPGEDREETLLLPYKALVGTFVPRYDYADGFYYMQQTFDIDRDAPQPVVTATLPDRGFECGRDTVDIVMQNVGTRAALRTRVTFPYVNGCSFRLLNDLPAVLQPGETFVLRVAYKGPDSSARRYISTARVAYAFDIDGRTLSETDDYSMFVGCGGGRPVVVPPTPEPDPDPNPDPNPNPDPDPAPKPQPLPDPWVPMPTYGTFFRLELDDDSLRVGRSVEATLIVRNDGATALRNMRFVPAEADADTYEDRTSLFAHTLDVASGFTADGAALQLAPGTEGRLRLTFTPQPGAATTAPVEYLLGGQLHYTEPATSIATTAALYDYVVTVWPATGEVQATYFIGRTLPATFALLVENMGDSPFADVALTATLPVAVADADGQTAPMKRRYAALGGQAANVSFEDFQAANNDGAPTLAARWLYTADVPAHIADIEAIAPQAAPTTATQVTINRTRELVRCVSAATTTDAAVAADESESAAALRAMTLGDAYLVNDIDDEYSRPDAVVTADGDEMPLADVSATATLNAAATTGEYRLHVTAQEAGWAYVRLADPTSGLMRLTYVTRQSDGTRLQVSNFWQTDATPLADYSVIQESIVHLTDCMTSTSETYILHFDERPDAPVLLLGVRLFTADGTEVTSGGVTDKRVTRLQVETTGPIAKVFLGGVLLRTAGRLENLENAVLTSSDGGRRWTIDISALEPKAGEHTLTVDASCFRAAAGRDAEGTATLSWTENLTDDVHVAVAVTDVAGTVTPATGTLSMGSHDFTATPAEGYRFVRWMDAETGEELGTEATLTLVLETSRSIVAVFAPLEFAVTVETPNATLLGMSSGIYAYGHELQLALQPDPGYVFSHWERNGLHFSDDVVTTDIITAGNIYTAVLTLASETAVRDVTLTGEGSADIYTVTGVRLPAGAHLPRGVYIVGRNKILKK